MFNTRSTDSSSGPFPGPGGGEDLRKTQSTASVGTIRVLGTKRVTVMFDVVFIGLTVFFFAVAAGYVVACERIK